MVRVSPSHLQRDVVEEVAVDEHAAPRRVRVAVEVQLQPAARERARRRRDRERARGVDRRLERRVGRLRNAR